jgi:uncharacterized membrane protein YbaN (DUF454 family)
VSGVKRSSCLVFAAGYVVNRYYLMFTETKGVVRFVILSIITVQCLSKSSQYYYGWLYCQSILFCVCQRSGSSYCGWLCLDIGMVGCIATVSLLLIHRKIR